MVAEPVPVFVSVICCETLPPIASGPKFKLLTELVSVADPVPPLVVPVPLAVMVVGELVASLTMENVADTAPAACGLKLIVAVRLPPAGIVDELLTPLTVKLMEEPVTFTAVIVAAPVPVLVSVTCCEEVLPTATEPKFKEPGETPSAAEEVVPESFVTKL